MKSLQERAVKADEQIRKGELVDGEEFFELALEEIGARIAVSLEQAKVGNYASDTGNEVVHRTFDTALQDYSDTNK